MAAVEKAQEITSENKNAVMLQQFNNPANSAVHMATTGPEIWRDTAGQVDIVVCGVGTGGTITGVGEYLKTKNSKIQVSILPDSVVNTVDMILPAMKASERMNLAI